MGARIKQMRVQLDSDRRNWDAGGISDGYENARGGGGVLGLMFAGYVPLASQSPHPILSYFSLFFGQL